MQSANCRIHLLSDDPAIQDMFGAHEKVAKAVLELIDSSDHISGGCIALEGKQGSGKSTTINIIEGLLKSQTLFFNFDAWAHKNDPLRRIFLERLIGECISQKWVKEQDEWQKKVDKLSRKSTVQTNSTQSEMTDFGRSLGLMLLVAIPLVNSLLFKDWYKSPSNFIYLVSLILLATPIILYVLYMYKYWRSNEDKRRKILEEVNSIAKVAKTTSTVEGFVTENPTSIEFQQLFDELTHVLDLKGERKLILVIDNLDRIQPENAIDFWHTIKTFFDYESKKQMGRLKNVWVLVPFDPIVITGETLKGAEENRALETASRFRSFLEKTFLTSFRIPPPINTNWRKYLLAKLTEAFPNHKELEFENILLVFSVLLDWHVSPPTFRSVSKIVNTLGSIHRQWFERHNFIVQALYVVHCMKATDIVSILGSGTSNTLLGSLNEALFPKDWREQLISIHYNLEKDDAVEVLLRPIISRAFINGEIGELSKVTSLAGFDHTFVAVFFQNLEQWSSSFTKPLTNIPLIFKRLDLHGNTQFNSVWERLRQVLPQIQDIRQLDDLMCEGLLEFVKREKIGGLEIVRKIIEEKIYIDGIREPEKQKDPSPLKLIFMLLSGLHDETDSRILIRCSADIYVHLLVYAREERNELRSLKRLKFEGNWVEADKILSMRMGEMDVIELTPMINKIVELEEGPMLLGAIRNSAYRVLANPDGKSVGVAADVVWSIMTGCKKIKKLELILIDVTKGKDFSGNMMMAFQSKDTLSSMKLFLATLYFNSSFGGDSSRDLLQVIAGYPESEVGKQVINLVAKNIIQDNMTDRMFEILVDQRWEKWVSALLEKIFELQPVLVSCSEAQLPEVFQTLERNWDVGKVDSFMAAMAKKEIYDGLISGGFEVEKISLYYFCLKYAEGKKKWTAFVRDGVSGLLDIGGWGKLNHGIYRHCGG